MNTPKNVLYVGSDRIKTKLNSFDLRHAMFSIRCPLFHTREPNPRLHYATQLLFYQPLKCGIDTFDNPSILLNCGETQFSFSNRRVKEDTLSANNSIADYQDLRHYFNF